MADLINPRTLKGFRDYPPELMIPRERLLEQARRVYRSYGFAPIDTPALEYAEILLGKGGEESDKLIYRFTDHGDRDVALRFDLTVPFARFAAQYIGELGTPFKRYAHGPGLARREHRSTAATASSGSATSTPSAPPSNAADIEMALVIHDLMRRLGFERFEIRVNNRLVLNGLLEELGLAGQGRAAAASPRQAAEDRPRGGRRRRWSRRPASRAEQAERVLALAETQGTNAEILDRLRARVRRQREGGRGHRAGCASCSTSPQTAGVPEERIRLDLSIARGLDYYTGTIYETFLTDLPGIGSVCSGGRYDNLAGLYTKQALPGVGASLGLDRLLAAMEELKLLPKAATPAPVLVVQFDAERLGDYQRMARALRAAGIGVEVYPEAKKVGQQLQYAEKRGFRLALIAGADEFAAGRVEGQGPGEARGEHGDRSSSRRKSARLQADHPQISQIHRLGSRVNRECVNALMSHTSRVRICAICDLWMIWCLPNSRILFHRRIRLMDRSNPYEAAFEAYLRSQRPLLRRRR